MSFDDTIDAFKAMRQCRSEMNAARKVADTEYLTKAGIHFTSHNNGQHLQIRDSFDVVLVDFWPSTGKWKTRNVQTLDGRAVISKYGHGMSSLMECYRKITGVPFIAAKEHTYAKLRSSP